jgi:hypothetical protein
MLGKLRDSIAGRRQRQKFEMQNPTAAKLRTIVPKCLVCNADSTGHRFAQIASMPCNEQTKPRVMALFHHVRNHEWEPLKGFTEFRADQDDAIAYAVTGPHEGGMVVLIRDPVELYARVEIYLEERIAPEEVERIKGLIPAEEWHDF